MQQYKAPSIKFKSGSPYEPSDINLDQKVTKDNLRACLEQTIKEVADLIITTTYTDDPSYDIPNLLNIFNSSVSSLVSLSKSPIAEDC